MTIIAEENVLKQIGTTFGYNGWLTIFCILGIIFIISVLVFGFLIDLRNGIVDKGIYCGIFLLYILCILLIGVVGFFTKPVYEEYPRYTILLNEEISFNDFYNKYNVIEQINYNTYIVEEKAESNN